MAAEPPLPDAAVVVRGGYMKSVDLTIGVATEFDRSERYGLSVCSLAELTANEIAVIAVDKEILPHSVIRESTVGAIRSLGYDVIPDGSPHALILFAHEPSESEWSALRSVFASPRPNPGKKEAAAQ